LSESLSSNAGDGAGAGAVIGSPISILSDDEQPAMAITQIKITNIKREYLELSSMTATIFIQFKKSLVQHRKFSFFQQIFLLLILIFKLILVFHIQQILLSIYLSK
jgi:uncharacterized spore protein YtfJ